MRKTDDFVQEYQPEVRVHRCRVRVYQEDGEIPIVVVSQLPESTSSVTNFAEDIATLVWRRIGEPRDVLWIEHYYRGTELNPSTKVVTYELYDRPFRNPRWTNISRTQITRLIGEELE